MFRVWFEFLRFLENARFLLKNIPEFLFLKNICHKKIMWSLISTDHSILNLATGQFLFVDLREYLFAFF
jgi:hypothetical protein